jgi:peptidoglycan/xylan/chitin deacetylase (PgdA/CDA1 family)
MIFTRREFLKLGGSVVLFLPFAEYATAESVNIPVLVYHDISHQPRRQETVTPPLFAAQMEWLYGMGYRAISLGELESLDTESARCAVVITFDDGYASFMNHAFPLLAEYGFKATINIIGRYAGGFVSGNDPRISWDECRYLVRSGLVEIGCHTYDLHTWYGMAPRTSTVTALNEKLAQDLSLFQGEYEKEMGRSASILAWPYGMHDSKSIEIAKQAGFRYLLNSDHRSFVKGRDRFDIPRLSIQQDTDLRLFRERIERRT